MLKIIKTLLIILILLLPLINSHLIDLFWIKWWFYVDWNYEFTKVVFFNIFSSMILSLFFIKIIYYKEKIKIPLITILISIVFILSTYFSDFQFTSLFWNNSKWASLLMYLNLVWIFIVLINIKKKIRKKLIKTLIFSSLFVSIIWIKEYYFPTFDYWNLSNRAISTLWHPNYLIGYYLLLIPFIYKKIKNNYYKTLLVLIIFTLFLTKSIWWILIFLIYSIYYLISKNNFKITKKYILLFVTIIIIIVTVIIYNFWLLTKLNSFISRFYIWETTIRIIFSDLTHFFFWNWIATLDLIFNSFKSPELYIFENIWFTADRPHNLFLNIFYYFWFIWFSLFSYLLFKLIKNFKNKPYYHSIILFLFFSIFNFWWIVHYLILILFISYIYKWNKEIKNKLLSEIFLVLIVFISIFWAIFSYTNYKLEYTNFNFSEYKPQTNFITNKISNEEYQNYKDENSAEFYFNLWNSNWKKIYPESIFQEDNDKAIEYYKLWLAKLPDMWNENSKYYNNIFIKNLYIPERFYSRKFSNLEEILKRVWINKRNLNIKLK